MLSVSNLSVQFGKRVLFDEVNTTFNNGNCYGIIGANGAGKSTFLKIIAGKQDATSGHVHLEPGKRMSVLEQNHNLYDEHTVLETIIMGNKPLFKLKSEIDALYADYTDENAEKIGSSIEEDLRVNQNTNPMEFSLRDPDGYYITVTEFHNYEGQY